MTKIVIIDGHGGGMGRALIEHLVAKRPADCRIIAVGANPTATANMRKAGADAAATGADEVCKHAATADLIAGPLGIVLAGALQGEVTPAMAVAVAGSTARRVLIPVTRCATTVVGVGDYSMSEYIAQAADAIYRLAGA